MIDILIEVRFQALPLIVGQFGPLGKRELTRGGKELISRSKIEDIQNGFPQLLAAKFLSFVLSLLFVFHLNINS